MDVRFVAWGLSEEGASFHLWRLGASCLLYLLKLFYFREGRISLAGWFIPGRISSHQIAVRSVAEGGHLLALHSCGGVFRSDITVGSWSRFSVSGSLHEGRTILGRIWWIWACISSLLELLLYQVLSCIVFIVTLHLLSSYIHIDLKLVFPRGVLSRVMLTKNTCVYKCMILVLRSVHN